MKFDMRLRLVGLLCTLLFNYVKAYSGNSRPCECSEIACGTCLNGCAFAEGNYGQCSSSNRVNSCACNSENTTCTDDATMYSICGLPDPVCPIGTSGSDCSIFEAEGETFILERGWVKLVDMDKNGVSLLYGSSIFNNLFWSYGTGIFRYDADNSTYALYERLVGTDSFDYYSNIVDMWSSNDNEMGVSFNIYSSYDDLVARTNPWQYCNYDDDVNMIGFPRDCGYTGPVEYKWLSQVKEMRVRGEVWMQLRCPSGSVFNYGSSYCTVCALGNTTNSGLSCYNTHHPTSWPTTMPSVHPTTRPSMAPSASPSISLSTISKSISYKVKNSFALGAITSSGQVMTWGHRGAGGGETFSVGGGGVREVVSSMHGFAALLSDGSMVSWGYNSDSSERSLSNIKSLVANEEAFAALTSSGEIITFGNGRYGGDITSTHSSNSWDSSNIGLLTSNIKEVVSNACAFAALKSDGGVVTWGQKECGAGNSYLTNSKLTKVHAMYANRGAFAFVRHQEIYTVGNKLYGGQKTMTDNFDYVVSNPTAFVGFNNFREFSSWGNSHAGGGSHTQSTYRDVEFLATTDKAFAALKRDGTVVAWGDEALGGSLTQTLSNVAVLYSNRRAFAALHSSGAVYTWGFAADGGDSSEVSESLQSDVVAIYSTAYAFAALKRDGSVVTWGQSSLGGNSSPKAAELSSDVKTICHNEVAFAALKSDGTMVTWGHSDFGGDSTQHSLSGARACFTQQDVFVLP